MFDSTIGKIVIKPVFDGKGVFAGIKRFDKQLKGLNKPIKQLNSSFNELFQIAGIAGLTAMTLNAAKLGREMGLISRKTGVAVDRISSMQNAFAASGGDAKEVSRTLDRITTGLARVSVGDARFTSALSSININAWDENGQLKNPEQIYLEAADRIKQQLGSGLSLAQVVEIMGDIFKMSQAEVEYLSVGSAELLEIQKKYNKEIGVLGKKESDALNSINNSISKLRATVGVTYDKLIAESAPLLQTMLNGVQEVAKFFQDHKDLFGPLLTGLAGLSVALKALPILFTAISTHPLVAMAIAAMGAGYAIGGGFGKPDTMKEAEEKALKSGNVKYSDLLISKVRRGVELTEQEKWHYERFVKPILEANEGEPILITEDGEIYEKSIPPSYMNGGNVNIEKKIEKLFKDPPKIEFPELFANDSSGGQVDLSKVPDRPDGGNVKIEQNMTINANGDVPTNEIKEAVKDGAREGVSYIPASNGQMQPAI